MLIERHEVGRMNAKVKGSVPEKESTAKIDLRSTIYTKLKED